MMSISLLIWYIESHPPAFARIKFATTCTYLSRDHRAQVSAPTGSLGYTVLHGAGHIECKLAGSSKLQHTTDTPRDVHIYILCRQMCLNTPPDIYGGATGKARAAYKFFPLLASQRSR